MNIRTFSIVLGLAALVPAAATAANLVLVGDSTLAPRKETVKLGSWGDALKPSLKSGNGIVNCAVGGRTVRTTKAVWDKTKKSIAKGDFVIIQFGINDANKKKLVEVDEFKETLAFFVEECRELGATPVLASPVCSDYAKDAAEGAEYKDNPTRRIYADYTKEVATDKKVDFVDMTALTEAELAKVGLETSRTYYVGKSVKEDKKTGKKRKTFDTTHPSKAGAKRYSELFLADVKARKLPVADLFE